MAGDYPKDFKFTGWHPQCRCFITYINKTDEEFWRDLENGENNASVNTVNDVPLSFKEWCIDNSQRLEVSKENNKLPYFISDNDKFVKSIMAKKNVVYKSVTRQQVDSLIKEGFLNQDESISIIKMIDDGTPIREIQAKLGNISKGISHSVFEYSQLYLENPNVTKLLNDISKYEGNDEVLRCFLINKLKDECGIMCRKQLERADLTSGLKYDRIVKNRTISKECSFISEGKTIDIPKLKIDGVVFKDDKGYEYIYPIGTTPKNAVANAGRLSVEINKLPQYLKNNVRSVTLTDAINPLDKYWSIVYNNSESEFHSAASCGLDVVFWKYSKNGDISHYIKHELAHNFDNAHNLSLNQLWTDAVDLDVKKAKSPNPAYPTDYAKKNYKEDFAESVAIFLKSKEEFRNKFPYRTEVIELFIKHFPNA